MILSCRLSDNLHVELIERYLGVLIGYKVLSLAPIFQQPELKHLHIIIDELNWDGRMIVALIFFHIPKPRKVLHTELIERHLYVYFSIFPPQALWNFRIIMQDYNSGGHLIIALTDDLHVELIGRHLGVLIGHRNLFLALSTRIHLSYSNQHNSMTSGSLRLIGMSEALNDDQRLAPCIHFSSNFSIIKYLE